MPENKLCTAKLVNTYHLAVTKMVINAFGILYTVLYIASKQLHKASFFQKVFALFCSCLLSSHKLLELTRNYAIIQISNALRMNKNTFLATSE